MYYLNYSFVWPTFGWLSETFKLLIGQNMETLRRRLFDKGEPVREKVLDYCYEQVVPTNT